MRTENTGEDRENPLFLGEKPTTRMARTTTMRRQQREKTHENGDEWRGIRDLGKENDENGEGERRRKPRAKI